MKSEEEIFRAWLIKIIKKDRSVRGKKITGSELADAIGINGPKLTAYHSGRMSGGVKKLQPIPLEIQDAMLKYTETSRKEALEIGRQELYGDTIKEHALKAHIDAEIPALKAEIAAEVTEKVTKQLKEKKPVTLDELRKNEDHHNVIDEFQNQALATEINSLMVEIERIDPDELEEIKDTMISKLKKLKRKIGESTPKKTANGPGE